MIVSYNSYLEYIKINYLIRGLKSKDLYLTLFIKYIILINVN